eukprot:jgi/Botrbrau1/2663/Bobra.0203s0012.1
MKFLSINSCSRRPPQLLQGIRCSAIPPARATRPGTGAPPRPDGPPRFNGAPSPARPGYGPGKGAAPGRPAPSPSKPGGGYPPRPGGGYPPRPGGPPQARRPPKPNTPFNQGPRRPPGPRQEYKKEDDGILINEAINVPEVRLIGSDKSMLGVMTMDEALDLADEEGVDVVLISPDASPPVARLVDYSKYKYELSKTAKEAQKKQREARQDLKELKLRPGTDLHDYQVRLKAAQKFISKGDKVKLTLVFRGREMEHKEVGTELMERFVADVGDDAVVTAAPSMQGRTMSMILGPNKSKGAA